MLKRHEVSSGGNNGSGLLYFFATTSRTALGPTQSPKFPQEQSTGSVKLTTDHCIHLHLVSMAPVEEEKYEDWLFG
jgi:hypothetical protein